jgi:disulfide bond formation protein DsbB
MNRAGLPNLKLAITFILLVAISLSGCSTKNVEPTPDVDALIHEQFEGLVGDSENGKTKFTGTCAGCHGMDGHGMPGLGQNLTDPAIQELPDEVILQKIVKGVPKGTPENKTGVDMPPKGNNPSLSDQDLVDILAYLRTLKTE